MRTTNTGNPAPASSPTPSSTQPAQLGSFTSGDTPPHRVAFSTESFVETVHGGIAPSALSPTASSGTPARELTPSSAATATREPTSGQERTTKFWRGPHPDETNMLDNARSTAIDRLATKLGADLTRDSGHSYRGSVKILRRMSR